MKATRMDYQHCPVCGHWVLPSRNVCLDCQHKAAGNLKWTLKQGMQGKHLQIERLSKEEWNAIHARQLDMRLTVACPSVQSVTQ